MQRLAGISSIVQSAGIFITFIFPGEHGTVRYRILFRLNVIFMVLK